MAKRPFLRRGPSGPLADSAIVQVGYDEIVEEVTLPDVGGAFVPRNAAGDPLRVVLPDVQPGNYIEVDWRMWFRSLSAYYYLDLDINFAVMITFDGSAPSLVPGPANPTLLLFNSSGGVDEVALNNPLTRKANCNALAVAQIPAGATTATVQVLYDGGPVEFSVEVDEGEPAETQESAGTLKVTELSDPTQPGPGTLDTPDLAAL